MPQANVGGSSPSRGGARSATRPLLSDPDVFGEAISHFVTGLATSFQNPQPRGAESESAQNAGARGPFHFESFGRTLIGAFENGVRNVAENTRGLSDDDRRWVQQQGSNLTALAAGGISLLQNAGPMVAFFEQQLGRHWQNQNSGLDEASIQRWVDEREIPAATVEAGGEAPLNLQPGEVWKCPICFSGCDGESEDAGLCLLCDSDGSCWHVFHKKCAAQWLKHSASCPICRRGVIIRPT